MAWELPHKPFYIEQELQDAYKNGDFLLIDRSDTTVDDEPTKPTTTKKPVMTKTNSNLRFDMYNSQPNRYYVKDRYYADDGYYNKLPASQSNYNYRWPSNSNKFDYYFTNGLMNSLNGLTRMKYNGKDQSWPNDWHRKQMTVNR